MDIEHSLDEILACVDPPFAERFYALFLQRFPRYKPLFRETDWRSQSAMLTIGLQTLVKWHLHPTPTTEQYLRLLGEKHRGFEIQSSDYQLFEQVLLDTLAGFHGENWSQSLAEQWSAAFNASIGVMLQRESKSELHVARLAYISEMIGDMHDQIRRSGQLVKLAETIDRGILLDDVMNYVYDEFRNVVPYNRIGLAFIDETSGMVTASWARSDRPVHLRANFKAQLATSSLANVLKTGQPRILNDLEEYLRTKPQSVSTQLILREGIKSSLTCPLISLGQPVGFLFFSSIEVNTYQHAHVEFFESIARRISVIVEKARLFSQLQEQTDLIERHNQKMSQELQFAQRFQQSLIPSGSLEMAGLTIESLYEPTSQVGGDLLEIVELDKQRAWVFVADATGHGVKAAMVMAATKSALDHARRCSKDPAAILRQVNDQLYDLLHEEGSFVTALGVVVDTPQKSLHVASAGHPFPWQYHARHGKVSHLHGPGGLPLGIMTSENYETVSFPLEQGDAALICTDGVFEGLDQDGDLYGSDRLANLLREHGANSARKVIQEIQVDLIRHRKGVEADDDVAVVAIKWDQSGSA